MKYSAVIVAAGASTRFNQGISKMLYRFSDGTKVIDRTIRIFEKDEDCRQIVVVCSSEVMDYLTFNHLNARMTLCYGGYSRQESVYHGLMAVTEKLVMVHDGARCFLEREDLESLKQKMSEENGALLVKSMVDTVKVVENGIVVKTLNRDSLKRAQTPQGFPTAELIRCYQQAEKEGFSATDDCQLVEKYSNMKVICVESKGHNTKVTVIDDVRGE